MSSLSRWISDQLSELQRTSRERDYARSIGLAESAVSSIGLPWQKTRTGVWCLEAEERRGFTVQLEVLAQSWFVFSMASAGIVLAHHGVSSELAVDLLEQNQGFAYGSFRLNEGPEGMTLVMGQLFDSRLFDAPLIAGISRTLISQMQSALIRLYARDLIDMPHE